MPTDWSLRRKQGRDEATKSALRDCSFSIIVCTRDRPVDLARALTAILRSVAGDFELIVVDQSATDESSALLNGLARGDARIRLVRDTGRGLSRARNLGAKAASRDVLLFTDDDCTPAGGWPDRIVTAMCADPSVGIAFGSVVTTACDASLGFIVGYIPPRPRRMTGRLAKLLDGGIGANMALRRQVLFGVGGFDELLGSGSYFPSCEDGDMAYRVLAAGHALLHVPDAQVTHHGFRDWEGGGDLTRRTFMAVTAAFMKHARLRDGFGLLLVIHACFLSSLNLLVSLVLLKRPLGVGRLIASLTGIWRSFELDVESERRLYKSREQIPKKQHPPPPSSGGSRMTRGRRSSRSWTRPTRPIAWAGDRPLAVTRKAAAAMPLLGRLPRIPYYAGLAARSLRGEGLGFLALWPSLQRLVPGWLPVGDARLLYALAHHGPGRGAIVEIGSAWGKSTIFLASGSKQAGREKVFAIDPHSRDPWYLRRHGLTEFSSLAAFQRNIHRFCVGDWVVPVVSTSTEAARTLQCGPIRLLFIDGLHTYEGVKADIEDWVPRVIPGGIIVFDDYLSEREDVGVRRAADELVASGSVGPVHRGRYLLVWTRKH
jgi:GT2 family glycosyltransferase/predicted O-methyltransferase YrrM